MRNLERENLENRQVATLPWGDWCRTAHFNVGQTQTVAMIQLLAASYYPPGELVESCAHEHADDAVVHRYAVPDGALLVPVWRGLVHEVIHQTPCATNEQSAARNKNLFAHYGEGHEWHEILDNGFGKTYRRPDQQRYALWSYAMDFTTFGTMAFHEVKWR